MFTPYQKPETQIWHIVTPAYIELISKEDNLALVYR